MGGKRSEKQENDKKRYYKSLQCLTGASSLNL